MEKISVIVPVYNVEKYLKKCLNSLLEQDYQNYEIILINDASTDSSLSICNQFAKQSDRIKLFNLKTNQGISNVRNIGLQYCSGQYVAFVDSDDYVSPKFLSSMYSAMKEKKADIVCCNHFCFRNNKKTLKVASQNQNSFQLTRSEFIQLVFTLKLSRKMQVLFQGFMWNKLFRRKLLTNVHFESHCAEDELFLSNIFSRVNTVYYVGEPLYFYNIRDNSLSHVNSFVLDQLKTRYRICQELKTTSERKIIYSALYQQFLNAIPCFLSDTKLTLNDLDTFRTIYRTQKDWDTQLLHTEGTKLLFLQTMLFFLTHFNINATMKMIQLLRPICIVGKSVKRLIRSISE